MQDIIYLEKEQKLTESSEITPWQDSPQYCIVHSCYFNKSSQEKPNVCMTTVAKSALTLGDSILSCINRIPQPHTDTARGNTGSCLLHTKPNSICLEGVVRLAYPLCCSLALLVLISL